MGGENVAEDLKKWEEELLRDGIAIQVRVSGWEENLGGG